MVECRGLDVSCCEHRSLLINAHHLTRLQFDKWVPHFIHSETTAFLFYNSVGHIDFSLGYDLRTLLFETTNPDYGCRLVFRINEQRPLCDVDFWATYSGAKNWVFCGSALSADEKVRSFTSSLKFFGRLQWLINVFKSFNSMTCRVCWSSSQTYVEQL